MRVRKKFLVWLCIVSIILMSGCTPKKEVKSQETSKETKQDIKKDYYISFTVTKEENNEFNTYNYIYDFETDKVELKDRVPYTSQYPLTAYSYSENALYYTHRRDGERSDEVYRKDLATGKTECLTDTIFAVNYIFPFKDKIYIAAVEKKTRAVGLFKYQNKKLQRLLEDKDAFVWQVNYNPDLDQIVFNTYSDDEAARRAEKNEEDKEIMGMNSIYIADVKKDSVKKISESEEGYMTGIILDSAENIYYQLGGYKQLKNGKGIESLKFDELNIDKVIYMNQAEIYYISEKGELVKYNFENGKKKVLYTVEEELLSEINNAVMLKK
ncbi:hypothetical protein [Faecalimonas sp.]